MENEKMKAEFTEKAVQKVMGKILDMGRISGMSDRSFEQFQRSTKIECNNLSRILLQELFGISSKVQEEPKRQ